MIDFAMSSAKKQFMSMCQLQTARKKRRQRASPSHPLPIVGTLLQALLLICSSPLLVHLCCAQELPSISVEKYDYSESYRTNICDRQRQIHGNEIEIRDALRDLNLTVHFTNYPASAEDKISMFHLTEEGTLPTSNQGIIQILVDELAERAGFKWRHSFAVTDHNLNPEGYNNKTWTDVLHWGTTMFDIVADYYDAANYRRALGISFPEGWYDSTVVLVSTLKTKRADFAFWSFMRPFDTTVWIAIVAVIILSGLLYNVLERLNGSADERNLGMQPLACAFLSSLAFTGHFEFKPNSAPARLLTFSLSFFSLLVISTYTANLASFLLTRNMFLFPVNNIDELEAKGGSLCLYQGTNTEHYITTKYPSLKVVGKNDEVDILLGLKNNECTAAAIVQSSFDILQRDWELNGDCSLRTVGKSVVIFRGGFATAMDTGSNCTSLVSHVLDLHMLEMKSDGTYEKIWKDFLGRKEGPSCPDIQSSKADNGRSSEEDTVPLDLKDLGGVFSLHAILSLISICLALGSNYLPHRCRRRCYKQNDGAVAMQRQSIWSYPLEIMVGSQENLFVDSSEEDRNTIWTSSREFDRSHHQTLKRRAVDRNSGNFSD